MADVTPILISQLSAQTTLQDTDYFIVGGEDAKKITVAQMKEALGINTLNTNMVKIKRITKSASVQANADYNISVDFEEEPIACFIERAIGSGNTTNIVFCNFTTFNNIRVKSTSAQTVTVHAVCLHR